MVVSEVFGEPVPSARRAGQATVLEALQAGIVAQLAVLDDRSLTGTGKSSAEVLGVAGRVVAAKLTGQLVREIVVRGSHGGPLFPLASQLNDDLTHLRGQRIEAMLGQLAGEIQQAVARIGGTRAVAPTPVTLAQLPAATTGFTGRDDELAMLTGLLDPSNTAGPVLVSAVAGLAGVGKTTLAMEAGHAARQRGWFGGGVLFLDLHGYDEAPVQPDQALDVLLRTLGVSAEDIPRTVDERAGLYRSVLAQIRDPVLLIADNASSETQIEPLLPGAGPHKVLVTSRNTLARLDARLVDITVLDKAASIKLLDTALRSARPHDDRIGEDPASAATLARLCGGLPLALQITAALLKADPALSTAELASQLSSEKDRLPALRYDDGSGTAGPSVAAAFELSYRRLDDAAKRMFRLLAAVPGPDFSTEAAAVLADLQTVRARRILTDLAQAHLIEPFRGTTGRWRMHDLLHLYAQQLSVTQAGMDGRVATHDRLFDYYLEMAKAVNELMRRRPSTDASAGREEALAWVDAEGDNLLDEVRFAWAADWDRQDKLFMLELLLTHEDYLLHANLDTLIDAARSAAVSDSNDSMWLLKTTPQAIHAAPDERISMFSVTEVVEELGTSYRKSGRRVPYLARWAKMHPRPRSHIFDNVKAVCPVTVNGQELLASGGPGDVIRIWNPITGQLQQATTSSRGDEQRVISVCPVTVDSRNLIASASRDLTVRIWDPARLAGNPVKVMRGQKYKEDVSLCPVTVNGQELLASGSADGEVRIWNLATSDNPIAVGRRHHGWVYAMCQVTVNGQELLASTGNDGTIRLWNPTTMRELAASDRHHASFDTLCAVTVNGQELLATGGPGDVVRIWNPIAGQWTAPLQGHREWVSSVCQVTVNGQELLASGSHDSTVRIWDPAARACLLTIPVHQEVMALCEAAGILAIGLGTGLLAITLNNLLRTVTTAVNLACWYKSAGQRSCM